MSDVASVRTAPDDVRLSEQGAVLSLPREEYGDVSCRPMDVAPGPKDASRPLRLRCKLDELADRAETRLRRLGIRGLGLGGRIARRVGLGEWYHRLPGMRTWRTPTPIVAPIFIVGSPRSGTSILGKVLGHQGEALYLAEARPAWYGAMPILDQSKFHWRDGRPQGRLYLDETDYSEEAKALLERDFGWALRFSGRDRLIEKMPINLFCVRWIRRMWPDAKFVQIVRDPFSTTASKSRLWPSIDERKVPGAAIRKMMYLKLFPDLVLLLSTDPTPYEWYLFEWRIYTEEGARLKRMFPGCYRVVRLEDLQRHPKEVLETICDFAGLRFTPRLERGYQSILDQRVRLAKPKLDRTRCVELLGDSAHRCGYEF